MTQRGQCMTAGKPANEALQQSMLERISAETINSVTQMTQSSQVAMEKVGQGQEQRNGRIWIWENKRDDEMGRQNRTNTVD